MDADDQDDNQNLNGSKLIVTWSESIRSDGLTIFENEAVIWYHVLLFIVRQVGGSGPWPPTCQSLILTNIVAVCLLLCFLFHSGIYFIHCDCAGIAPGLIKNNCNNTFLANLKLIKQLFFVSFSFFFEHESFHLIHLHFYKLISYMFDYGIFDNFFCQVIPKENLLR